MNDLKKSALWALISIPISVLFLGMLVHGDGILQAPYLPGFVVSELLGMGESWVLPGQYFGYFLLIYSFIKIKRALRAAKGEEPITKKELIAGVIGALLVFGILGAVFLAPLNFVLYKIVMWILCLGFISINFILDNK